MVSVRRVRYSSGALLSTVKKDGEARQLQLLENLEVLLGYANVDDEGICYSFKLMSFDLVQQQA